ncbi:MAG: glycosyltransferase family 1 protein [Chloroflexi bacterium]|nr:glycosyltransferase family 1 protein [Chloroflexota bacterium]
MKINLIAFGTRGDVQPALALALGLRDAGHEVVIFCGTNFVPWVESYGFKAHPGLDMDSMMSTEDAVEWSERGTNPMVQLRVMRKLLQEHSDDMTRSLEAYGGDCDLLVSGFVSTPFAQVIAEKHGLPLIEAALQPYRATRSAAASLSPITKRDSRLNRWFGLFAQRMIGRMVQKPVAGMRERLSMPAASALDIVRRLSDVPVVNGFSRHVVPHPADYPALSATVGYWFLEEASAWTPPPDLVTFLEGDPAPVYIGFGSMSSRNPAGLFGMIRGGVELAGVRAVVMSRWAVENNIQVPETMYVLDRAPHNWLMQHVSAVVHHGGAGTTAAGLRAGKPTLSVPHMADQPFWGRRVREIGAGPEPILKPVLTREALAFRLKELVGTASFAERASRLGELIRAEDGIANGVAAVERFADALGVK